MTSRTARQADRWARFMPGGAPRWVRIWDSGPETNDRYTVVYTGRYPKGRGLFRAYQYVGMNSQPFHPSYGVCQHGESGEIIDCPHGWAEQVGRKCRHNPELGRRIQFQDLPPDCRAVVVRDYCELWDLGEP